jgi:hypothetical protein
MVTGKRGCPSDLSGELDSTSRLAFGHGGEGGLGGNSIQRLKCGSRALGLSPERLRLLFGTAEQVDPLPEQLAPKFAARGDNRGRPAGLARPTGRGWFRPAPKSRGANPVSR